LEKIEERQSESGSSKQKRKFKTKVEEKDPTLAKPTRKDGVPSEKDKVKISGAL
jgi:hypothetical protein